MAQHNSKSLPQGEGRNSRKWPGGTGGTPVLVLALGGLITVGNHLPPFR